MKLFNIVMRWRTTGILAAGLGVFSLDVNSQFMPGLVRQDTIASNVVCTVYDPGDVNPCLRVQAGECFTDYQRKGFFRIGALPVGVLQDLKIRVIQSGPVTNRLARLGDWLSAQAAQRLEFRGLEIQVATGDCSNTLECGSGRIRRDGRWELTTKVRFYSATNLWEAERGVLQVAGQDGGSLALLGNPPSIHHLFSPSAPSTKTQEPRKTP